MDQFDFIEPEPPTGGWTNTSDGRWDRVSMPVRRGEFEFRTNSPATIPGTLYSPNYYRVCVYAIVKRKKKLVHTGPEVGNDSYFRAYAAEFAELNSGRIPNG